MSNNLELVKFLTTNRSTTNKETRIAEIFEQIDRWEQNDIHSEKLGMMLAELVDLGVSKQKIFEKLDNHQKELGLALKALKNKASECREQAKSLTRPGNVLQSFSKLNENEPISISLDKIEKDFPSIFDKVYPKRFQIPQSYRSPKLLVSTAFWTFWKESYPAKVEGNLLEKYYNSEAVDNAIPFFVTCALIEKEVPTYFVSKAILQALLNTELPKDFSLNEMPWPMDAMLFVLPEGILKGSDGEDIKLLAVCKLIKGKEYSCRGISWDNDLLNSWIDNASITNKDSDKIALLALNETGKIYGWQKALDNTDINAAAQPIAEVIDIGKGMGQEKNKTEEEQFVFDNLPKAAFQIVLAMLACPEMIEAGILERPEKKHKGKSQCALWKPNFFGKAYHKYEMVGPQDEPSHSMRAHWRRGHFRHQRFGEKRSGVKIIWIFPVFVNKDKLITV